MKITVTILLLIAISACNAPQQKDSVVHKTNDSISHPDKSLVTEKTISTDTFSIPTKDFVSIAEMLDTLNFTTDTARIKKLGYYGHYEKTYSVFFVKDIPFFKINPESNILFKIINNVDFIKEGPLKKMRDKKIIDHVKHLTGLFFRDKKNSSMSTDGFIEEWEFDTSENAKDFESAWGYDEFYAYEVYVNSFSHIFRKGNHFYTFFSRADWEANRLEKMYKEIRKKLDIQ